jgi:HEAT repeat protein
VLNAAPAPAREWVEETLAPGEEVVYAGRSSRRVALLQQLPIGLLVIFVTGFVAWLLWWAETVPSRWAPTMLPLGLVVVAVMVVLYSLPTLFASTRYFFVTNGRVLVYRNGMFGSERGAYGPDEMRSMQFYRAFFTWGGDVIFSSYTVGGSRSTTTYIKGLLHIKNVKESARAIHDTLLGQTGGKRKSDADPEEAFQRRDGTRRTRIIYSSMIGGLLAVVFVPTLILYLLFRSNGSAAPEPTGLDKDLANLRSNTPSVFTVRALAKAEVDPARQAEVVQALVPLARSDNGLLAPAAMQALATWGTADTLPLAHEVLARPNADGDMRLAAVDILGKHGQDKEVPVLARLMLEGGEMTTRCAAALARLGKRSVPELEKLLAHSDARIREAAAGALGQLQPGGTGKPGGEAGGNEILLLLGGLKDRDVGRQVEALKKLAARKPDEAKRAEVVEALRGSCNSDRYPVRRAALQAFTVWGSRDDAATLLLANLESLDNDVRGYALATLGEWKEPRAVAPMVKMLNGIHRETVARVLEGMGAVAEKGVADGLSTGNAFAQKVLLQILTKIGTKESVKALQAYRDKQRGPSRKDAEAVLEAIDRREKAGGG